MARTSRSYEASHSQQFDFCYTLLGRRHCHHCVLQELVDAGNTVVVIEHNLDVIKSVDWVIDLGPHGGNGGGQVVAYGTPEQVAEVKESLTGKYLKKYLNK